VVYEKDSFNRVVKETITTVDSKKLSREFTYIDDNNKATNLIKTIKLYKDSVLQDILTYTYDLMGRIVKVQNTYSTIYTTYQYDKLGRLVRENNKELNKSFVILYNKNGNITGRIEGAYTEGSIYDTSFKTNIFSHSSTYTDELIKYNNQTVSVSQTGNITAIGSTNYTWSKGTLLSRVYKSSYAYSNYYYDGMGFRRQKTVYTNGTTVTHNYQYDGSRILKETITGGSYAGTLDFIYLGNQITGFTYKNKQYFFQKNLQGDIINIYDNTNTLVASYKYDAWGNCTITLDTNSIGTINPFRYRGYYYDRESNLYYCNARYYNPEILRWMSLDSLEYLEEDRINGCNLYAYCNNDPVNYSDEYGYVPVPIDIISNLIGWTTQFLEYIEKLSLNKMSIIDLNMAKKIARKAGHTDSARAVMRANNAMVNSTKNSVKKLHKFNKYFGLAMYGLDVCWIIVENVVTKNPDGVTDSIVDIGISSAIYALSLIPYVGWALAISAGIATIILEDEIEEIKDDFANVFR